MKTAIDCAVTMSLQILVRLAYCAAGFTDCFVGLRQLNQTWNKQHAVLEQVNVFKHF